MAIIFKSPDDVADEYLTHLKAIKPTADVNQPDNDWWIRAKVSGGVVAGAYSDQRKASDDAFPQSARREGVLRHLKTWKNEDNFRPATASIGTVIVTGTNASTVTLGAELSYGPNGNTYETTEAVVLDGTSGEVEVQSVNVGQSQNLTAGAVLTFTSPPAGINSATIVAAPGLLDGKNEETEDEAASRVLAFIQTPPKGGHSSDYEQWAFDASSAVSFARCLRFPNGLGTIGVIITAGTTDIDTALDEEQTIQLEPSQDTIDAVEAYIETVRPEGDCFTVRGATLVEIDVEVRCKFVTGDKDTLLPEFEMTQGELAIREVKRAIYKTTVGGVKIDGIGYVTEKSINDMLSSKIGAENDGATVTGETAQVLVDQDVEIAGADDGENLNKSVNVNEKPIPGTITIVDWDA